MPARPRFQNLDQDKKDRILDAAAEEFADLGFESASLNRIIANAGISKGAAYYYFDDKDDLFGTVLNRMFDRLTHAIGDFKIEELSADSFWDELGEYSFRSMDYMANHAWSRRFIKMFWNYVDNHSDARSVHLVFSNMRDYSLRFIKHGQAIGTIRTDLPDSLLVELLFGVGVAIDRWILSAVEGLNDNELRAHAVTLLDVYRSLLSPRQVESP